MKSVFTVKNLRKGKNSNSAISGELFENDIRIAKFSRKARKLDNFGICDFPGLEVKFFSDASEVRFQTFADSLSVTECIELLIK